MQAESLEKTFSHAFDPLKASVEFAHGRVFYPLGLPAHIKSNDRRILQAAELSWGSFQPRFDHVPVELRVLVSEERTNEELQIPTFRAQKNLMTVVSDANHFGSCDLAHGFGFACTSGQALEEGDFFRYHFLEGMVYTLLNTSHLATIHSACVSWRNRGVLLIGESGAGKSSLSYACARRGWTYTSDDAISILLDGRDRRVMGNSTAFRFRPSIVELFPELSGYVRQRNGKPTLEIRTDSLPNLLLSDETAVEYIIFLNRKLSNSGPTLAPVSRYQSLEQLCLNPWPAELEAYSAQTKAIERLSEAPAFKLTYGGFDSAIDLIEQLIAGRTL